jgi:hypothetical protein
MESSHTKISEKTLCRKGSEKRIFLSGFAVEKVSIKPWLRCTILGDVDG